MNKVISFAFTAVCALLFCLVCTDNASADEELAQATQKSSEMVSSEQKSDATALVVYFSWSGNTRNVANSIATQTSADVFEITPETPYSDDYDIILDFARAEHGSNARPAIAGGVENFDRYNIVYVGFPNWWADMPMILYTFFDRYDFSGKTIAPFCTSGGSGLSDTVRTIRELEPNATVLTGLHIRSSSASDPDKAVSEWLASLGLGKQEKTK